MTLRALTDRIETLLREAAASPTRSSSASYEGVTAIGSEVPSAYVAASSDGHPAILLVLAAKAGCAVRLTGGLAFWASEGVVFRAAGREWTETAAILECHDLALVRTFAVMASHVLDALPKDTQPSWPAILALFEQWERLLRRHRLLSSEEELGLWGELWLIHASADAQRLVDGWQGPDREALDFVIDGIGVEAKATRHSGVHFVSQTQVAQPLGDYPAFFLSLDVAADAVRGKTLLELADAISVRCPDPHAFEERFLLTGVSRADAAAYTKRYFLTKAPAFFSYDAVPRVRLADSGVSCLRYKIQLDPELALTGARLREVAEKLRLDLPDQ